MMDDQPVGGPRSTASTPLAPGVAGAFLGLLAAATVVALAALAPSPATATAAATNATCPHAQLYLWLTGGGLVVSSVALLSLRLSIRIRTWRNRLALRTIAWPISLRALEGATLAATTGSWGLYGLVVMCGRAVPSGCELWPIHAAVVLAVGGIIVGLVATGWTVVALARDRPPGQETAPALVLLRCSCCPGFCQRLLVVFPILVVAFSDGLLWRQAVTHGCPAELTRCVLGSTLIFSSMLGLVGLGALGRWLHLRSPGRSPTERSRRWRQVLIFVTLLATGVTAVAWAVHCTTTLHHRDWKALVESTSASCSRLQLPRSVRFVALELYIVGALVLILTGCCRLERQLLREQRPQIDETMLSPNALRPAARPKTSGMTTSDAVV